MVKKPESVVVENVNSQHVDVLPRAAFSTSGPDTLVNSDYICNEKETRKRKRVERKKNVLEKKMSGKKNLHFRIH